MTATELPPEDRAPVRPPRRVSRGLLVAAVLATVVLAIATFMAFRPAEDDAVATLDPNALAPSPLTPAELESTRDLEGSRLPELEITTFAGDTQELTTGGRPLVVNFWAASCVPCVKEMPAIDQVAQQVGDDVEILGLQFREDAGRGEDMIRLTGVTYPVARDPSGVVFQELGGLALPTTVLIEADGTIALVHTGELSAGELRSLIDEHLVGS
jgi:thiol-disulfide isomerase/thioredoxin